MDLETQRQEIATRLGLPADGSQEKPQRMSSMAAASRAMKSMQAAVRQAEKHGSVVYRELRRQGKLPPSSGPVVWEEILESLDDVSIQLEFVAEWIDDE